MSESPKPHRCRKEAHRHVDAHGGDIAKRAASVFGITRQAVHKHLRRLVEEGALTESGQTRSHSYRLAILSEWENSYPIAAVLAEDVVWTEHHAIFELSKG
jgi:predicted ArsR family transcriptional regulator